MHKSGTIASSPTIAGQCLVKGKEVSEQNELALNSTSQLALTGNALGNEFGHQDYGTIHLNGVRLANEAWLLNLIAQRDELLALLQECLPHLDTAASAFKAVKPVRNKVRDAIAKAKGGAV